MYALFRNELLLLRTADIEIPVTDHLFFERGKTIQLKVKNTFVPAWRLFFSNGGIFLAFSLRRDSFESEIQITLVWSLLWISLDAKFGFFLFFLSLSSAAQFCVSGMHANKCIPLFSHRWLLHVDESLVFWFLTFGYKLKGNIYSTGLKRHHSITYCSQFLISCWWGFMLSKPFSPSLLVNCCHGLPRLWEQHNNSCCVFVCIPITTLWEQRDANPPTHYH